MMKTIGITTTIPIECLIAAGCRPVDLNNLFISHQNPSQLLDIAERAGFPLNTCTWIKGIYGACIKHRLETVICVTGGDCSNTLMLMEVLKLKGIKTIPFAYPASPNPEAMQQEMEKLCRTLGTSMKDAEEVRQKLAKPRSLTLELDRMTWEDGSTTGFENHIWLVSTSDFNQDYLRFTREIETFIIDAHRRTPFSSDRLRIGYIGVPPVFANPLYSFVEENNARVVYNEIQRQFAMPCSGTNLSQQYSNYTYPYDTAGRVRDISRQIKLRRIDGVIHYVQSFCHRAISDIIFRTELGIPILTLEGGSDYNINQHLKTRIEAFIDMLERSKIEKGKN
ncbi:MAG: 2-hydroxyacyl-CoA dehydratase [Dehalococcoidales bacterium]|jgi:benzoyl-CoA reductase/2-hydroxyglutaryl-CoA dehydratase subunit BcrC/BadD/HgdB|nr:2-hydroxyacyl-CoA dehydratase [Dehalococcoidales bacterium]MDD3264793.1 2-hydroxyacyl-CoA dehydratase [Dehalococcoidales bacterium]MDD4322405.1 2-hydroxyacyl-CoA dehydratase [Dehalococcoidales bacterium]MDD4794117.1 2-hydroxyacyl-CoA dehydratase [Dehalococcoidales bacterium]MDD5121893.1 2-hydroxyacyl-CoA dehydratase [Dehalococcoidales bacterium]